MRGYVTATVVIGEEIELLGMGDGYRGGLRVAGAIFTTHRPQPLGQDP